MVEIVFDEGPHFSLILILRIFRPLKVKSRSVFLEYANSLALVSEALIFPLLCAFTVLHLTPTTMKQVIVSQSLII